MKRRTDRKWVFALVVGALVVSQAQAVPATVVQFDDLPYLYNLTTNGYAGLTWEQGNPGYQGGIGWWDTDSSSNNYPHSPPHNAVNAWGSTLMGIGFPSYVDVIGAYFAAQGDETSAWTTGVRVHGYRDGSLVATTSWFNDIDSTPSWFQMDLNNVDRIVVESVPVSSGGGWYGMDDLTYIPEPATLALLALGGLALIRRRGLCRRAGLGGRCRR